MDGSFFGLYFAQIMLGCAIKQKNNPFVTLCDIFFVTFPLIITKNKRIWDIVVNVEQN